MGLRCCWLVGRYSRDLEDVHFLRVVGLRLQAEGEHIPVPHLNHLVLAVRLRGGARGGGKADPGGGGGKAEARAEAGKER